MPVTIEKVPDAPIVVVYTFPSENDIRQETIDTLAEIIRALDAQTGKVFMVTDLRSIKLGLDDIVMASSMATRGQNNLMHHPNLRGSVFVLGDGLMKMAIRGLNNATFGQVKAQVFDTVEDAVDYCREQVRAGEF